MTDEIEKTGDMLGEQTARTSTRGRPRKQGRDPVREASRGGPIIGRNGEVLTRTRAAGTDPFRIPDEIVPDGWSYQWNTVTVYNNADLVIGQSMTMYANGWRPVPAERHPGMFVPVGTKGDIVREGQRLEERPASMTEAARAEDVAVARQQMSDRDQALMGGKANARNLPPGMEMNPSKYRGTGGDLRMSIDPAVDAPKPSLPLAEPGE